eukprot:gene13870-16360_t
MSTTKNKRITLASRPHGKPTPENFKVETVDIPAVGDNQILLKTIYLSLDPYMRGRMSDAKSYAEPVKIGEVMIGGAVSKVVESKLKGYEVGDWVLGYTGWQEYAVVGKAGLLNLGKSPQHPSHSLGVLGMPGFTAYMGLLDIGNPKPGETVCVAAATGAVGAIVGQVAKLKGCHVVGIAGGPEKCKFAKECGFDECIDHYEPDLGKRLAAVCPKGIDVYFENVGGKVFDAVFPLLNNKARIPVCGVISMYNSTSLPPGPDRMGMLMAAILTKRMKVQGFIIFDDYGHRLQEFLSEMGPWVAEGRIKFKEHMVDGLDQAPQAFIDLLDGKNFGKVVIKVANE